MDDFGDFGETNPSTQNLDFGGGDEEFVNAPGDDPFAAAGGMQMNNQSNAFAGSAPMAQKHDDYTPEELEIIQRVDLEA